MSLIDIVILGIVALAGFLGYRSGLMSHLLGVLGIAPGLLLAVRLLPWVMERAGDRLSLLNPFGASAGVLLAGAVLGYIVGRLAGRLFLKIMPGTIRLADRLAGTLALAAAAGTVIWLLLPLAEVTPGWLSEQIEGSAAARFARNYLPGQPDVISSVRSLAGRLA